MKLTDREYKVVTNIYGDDTPRDLREIKTKQLVAMHERTSKAVQACYEDEDVESLGILLPLESKVIQVLHERL